MSYNGGYDSHSAWSTQQLADDMKRFSDKSRAQSQQRIADANANAAKARAASTPTASFFGNTPSSPSYAPPPQPIPSHTPPPSSGGSAPLFSRNAKASPSRQTVADNSSTNWGEVFIWSIVGLVGIGALAEDNSPSPRTSSPTKPNYAKPIKTPLATPELVAKETQPEPPTLAEMASSIRTIDTSDTPRDIALTYNNAGDRFASHGQGLDRVIAATNSICENSGKPCQKNVISFSKKSETCIFYGSDSKNAWLKQSTNASEFNNIVSMCHSQGKGCPITYGICTHNPLKM